MEGICTLANDAVYNQLVALLNSVEVNYSKDMPVCIIPYDDDIKNVKNEIKKREKVFLFSENDSIKRWEVFAQKLWQEYTKNMHRLFGRHSIANHRKFCCFDGPFDRFVFIDADTILMQPLDFVFKKLDDCDFVVYDYQHKDPSHVYNIKSSKLHEVFGSERVNSEIFCTGFFASKRNLLNEEKCNLAVNNLKNNQAEILYPRAPEQSLLNYIIMINNISVHNLAITFNKDKRTGNSVTSKHFKYKNNILYDKDNRLTYLHYIGVPSSVIKKVCEGENISFPYRDIFLHYRYLYEPEKYPKLKGKSRNYQRKPKLHERFIRFLDFRS